MKALCKHLTLTVLAGVLLAAGGALPSRAQPLTVYDALARLEAGHPELGRLDALLAANRGERLLSFGLEAPTLAYAREGIAGTAYAEQRLVLGQRLAAPLASYYGRRRLDAEAEALRYGRAARQARLREQVKKAFVEVQYAELLVALRHEGVSLAEQLIAAARLREEAGAAAGLETMRAEIDLAEAEAALAEAEHLRAQALTAAAAAAAAPTAQVVPPGPLTFVAPGVAREQVLGRLAGLPAAREAEAYLGAARIGVREGRATRLPGLSAEVFAQDFGGGFNRLGFQIGLQIPLPGTPAGRAPRLLAEAVLQERTWAREAQVRALAAEAEALWRAYLDTQALVVRYRDGLVPLADTLTARAHEGYLIGEVPLFALLDAQQTLLTARSRYAAALRDYTLRVVELERFTGAAYVFASPSSIHTAKLP